MATDPEELGRRLREGDRSAAPAALNVIENRAERDATRALLAQVSPAALGSEPAAHVIGITGPPGAGKSSLLSVLVTEWRKRGKTVAVLAVDPSSKRSGGSLLGDRARIEHDPRDDGVLIRSTAAAGRLGGLAAATREAAEALAPAFDVVVIETVGVGQSETDVEDVCDTVAVIVQPASGDVLQFLKAGIMEVPNLLVVTKADLGDAAKRSRRDLTQALAAVGSSEVPVLSVSSVPPPSGIGELADALDAHREQTDLPERRVRARRGAALREFTAEHGERALRDLGGRREAERLLERQDAAAGVTELVSALEAAPVSRRKRQAGPAVEAREEAVAVERGPLRRVSADLAVLTAVFAVVSALAELAGATSLGVAMGVGQIAFVVALLLLLLRG